MSLFVDIPPTSRIVYYWSFNGNTYDNITQLTSTNSSYFNNTSTGDIVYVSDRKGRANSAIHFNQNYLMIEGSTNPSSFVSTMFWFYAYGVPMYQFFIECFTQDGGYPLVMLTFNNGFYTYEDAALFYGVSSFANNTWTHYGLTHDGTNVYLYVNGELGYTTTASAPVSNPGATCCFGACDMYNGALPIMSYLDDVYVYNGYLTQDQVKAVMNYYI